MHRPSRLTAYALFLFMLLLIAPARANADQLDPTFTSTDGSSCKRLADATFSTTEHFDAGTQITVAADQPIDALYILWENVPGTWTLGTESDELTCGQEGFLHEYVKIPATSAGVHQATITIPADGATIADVYAFSAGKLPGFVQRWEPSYDEADILFVSTHADDECLFLGGAIPTYCNRKDVRVQLAYFCDFWQTEPYRNHEILNGLWVMGVTHYPQLGEFIDIYSETLDQAAAIYDYDDSLEYLVRTLRRFKPQVVVGQDIIAGEYGHGAHMWSAKMIADALEPAADEDQFEDSAKKYGAWDVPKTYFHLYTKNGLELDARVPLENLGGATALELAKASFLRHLSQQYTWFYVDDGYDEKGNPNGYPYSCTKYGLYRTLVGDDTGAQDLLENITTYDEQEAQAEQEAEAKQEAEAAQQAETETDAETEGHDDTHAEQDGAAVEPERDGKSDKTALGSILASVDLVAAIALAVAVALASLFVAIKHR